MKSNRHPRGRCRGAALVEFVLVAPLLLLMMLGVAELGRALFEYNSLTKAVREGARYMAGNAPGTMNVLVVTQQLRTETENLIIYGFPTGGARPLVSGLAPQNITIEQIGNDSVRVSADMQFAPAVFQYLPGFHYGPDLPLSFRLRASTTMRLL